MGVGGPIGVVRQWLEKFAVWIALATGIWLTVHAFSTHGRCGAPSTARATGPCPSVRAWTSRWRSPSRGCRSWRTTTVSPAPPGRASGAPCSGFFITNAWFLSLGALLLLGSKVAQEPKDFASAIALTAGWVALLILLADETHNAWADLYSSAVSLQNLFPKVKQRWLIGALGAACFLVAVFLDITRYQNFLFVIGSFFVPLFGMLTADFFVLRGRRYRVEQFYRPRGAYWYYGRSERPAHHRVGRGDSRLPPCQSRHPRGDRPAVAEARACVARDWPEGPCRALQWPSCSPSHSDSRRDAFRKDWRTLNDDSGNEEPRRHRRGAS